MKQVDYERMVEKCAREADRMPPGPERDELLRKIKLFESYAKIDNWIASPGLQPPQLTVGLARGEPSAARHA
jgi:hypothetical protein